MKFGASTLGAAQIAAIVFASQACITTTAEHQALVRRVDTLEHADADRRRLLEQADTQVRALQQQLDQARTQTRNLADLGARLDGMDQELRELHGAIDEIRRNMETQGHDESAQRQDLSNQLAGIERRLLEVERRNGLAPLVDPNQIPNAPGDILAQARNAMNAHDYNRARVFANALLQRAPQDLLADDARLLIAQSYVAENRNATAVQEFQRLLTDFPAGDTVPQALADMAESLIRLGLCVPAQRTLRILIERHAQTPQGQAARRRLDEVRHLPRAACTG